MQVITVETHGTALEAAINSGDKAAVIEQLIRDAGHDPANVKAIMINLPDDPAVEVTKPTVFKTLTL